MKMKNLSIEVPATPVASTGLKRIRKGLKPLIFFHIVKDYEEIVHPYTQITRIIFQYPKCIEKLIFRIIIGEPVNDKNCKEIK